MSSMMPDLQASLLCDDVRQERNGKFILIGIFDGLVVPALPAVVGRLCLVTRWCCGEGRFAHRSRLVAPDGRTLLAEGQPIAIDLADTYHVATSVEVFLNLRFQQEGLYWMEVMLEQQLRLRHPLHVRLVPPPPPPPAQGPATG
jgi:hypothetical protein